MEIRLQDITFKIGADTILENLTMKAASGQFVGILGPNGCGKSSLLKLITKQNVPTRGEVFVDGKDVQHLSANLLAKNVAVVPQKINHNLIFNVRDIVLMGRTPYRSMFQSFNQTDYQLVNEALYTVGLSDKSKTPYNELSGGEKQRTFIARAICQQARCLILDEPTNHLDIKYQFEVMRIVRSMNITVITALHDLNIASQFCDKVYLLNTGRVRFSGSPNEVISKESIRSVFDVNAEIIALGRNKIISFIDK